MTTTPKFKEIFGDIRIVGLAGEKNTGKTNNLVYLIKEFIEKDKGKTPIYVYGMPQEVMKYLKTLGVREISEIQHLVDKKDCILIIDEFQKLKLNDRRYKDVLAAFVDFVYHNNVYAILSSPNIREFNSVIGGVIERWLLKSVRRDMCVNGSQLKKVIEDYKGRYRSLFSVRTNPNELLLINDSEEIVIKCPYIKEADSKVKNEKLF